MSASDLELLARYARQGAEDAFAEVVSRHAGLVYATALRVTRTPQLAEEVVQAVFLDLARNGNKLRPDTVLATWLYTVTRYIAANTVRGETRRLVREQAAYAMNAAEEAPSPSADLEPLLDDALESLAEADRSAIILRFFEEKCLADVGAALGVSANAAQKRVNRAVEQMRGFFTHRGIATGTLAVTALLTANAKAAPVGLVTSVCTTVHATLPLTTTTLIKVATMTALQKSLVGLTLVASIGVAVRQTYEVRQLREQLKTNPSSAGSSNRQSSFGTAHPATKETRRARLEAILRVDVPMDRTYALMSFLNKLSSSELKEALENFANLHLPVDRSGDFKMILGAWAKEDPAAAEEYLRSHPLPGKPQEKGNEIQTR